MAIIFQETSITGLHESRAVWCVCKRHGTSYDDECSNKGLHCESEKRRGTLNLFSNIKIIHSPPKRSRADSESWKSIVFWNQSELSRMPNFSYQKLILLYRIMAKTKLMLFANGTSSFIGLWNTHNVDRISNIKIVFSMEQMLGSNSKNGWNPKKNLNCYDASNCNNYFDLTNFLEIIWCEPIIFSEN